MNENPRTVITPRQADVMQARFALRLTASLSELQARTEGSEIGVRLRFAREQAITCAQQVRRAKVAAFGVEAELAGSGGGGVMLARGPSTPWWLRLGALVPLAVLLAGLALIDSRYTQSQIDAAAEVDAAILVDELPPEAYRDQGFVEFLRSAQS